MATAAAGAVAGAAIKVIADYVRGLGEPPEEVARAFERLEEFIDDYHARVQRLEPIPDPATHEPVWPRDRPEMPE